MAPTEPLQELSIAKCSATSRRPTSPTPTTTPATTTTRDRRRHAVHHLLPPQGLDGSRGRDHPRRQRIWPKAIPSWRSAPSPSQKIGTCSPTRPTTPASASTPCTSRICDTANCCPIQQSASAPSSGPATTAPSSIPSKTRRPKRQYRLYRHVAWHAARGRRARLRRDGRALQHRRRQDPRRKFILLGIVQPHHQRVALLRRIQPEARMDIDRAAPRKASSITSTIAMDCSTSAPTNGPKLPSRHCAGRPPAQRKLDVSSFPPRRVMLEDVDLFETFVAIASARTACPTSDHRLRRRGTLGPSREIAFPEPVYTVQPRHQSRIRHHKFRYSYQSLVTPASVYDYDIASRRIDTAQAAGGSRRIRSHALCSRSASSPRPPMASGPRLHRLSPRHGSTTRQSPLGLRLRLLWIFVARRLQFQSPQPARSRRCDRLSRTFAAAAIWASPGTMPDA